MLVNSDFFPEDCEKDNLLFDSYEINSDSIPIDDNLKINKTCSIAIFPQLNTKYFNNKSKRTVLKRPFSIEEDKLLSESVNIYGLKNWSIISENMKLHNFDRSTRQCRDRYLHYLDPGLKINEKWDPEEDNNLIEFVNKNGKKWKMFEKYFPGRSEVALRNRYYLLKRKIFKNEKKIKKSLGIIPESLYSCYNKVEKNSKIQTNKKEFDDSLILKIPDDVWASELDDFL